MRPGEERNAFIDAACFGDPGLRNRILDLLEACRCEAANPLDVIVDTLEPDETVVASVEFLAESNEADGTIDVSTHPNIGPYQLLEPLGLGGMGAVYLALQSQPLQRKVALKLIRPGLDSREVIARFETERRALAMMDHPNIARVLDAGTTERMRPYFVMELVLGPSLIDFCQARKLTLRERLELMIIVCRAIQHAHQKGIVHRDLKPSNVLVARQDGIAVPKVIDFGIAKALDQEFSTRTFANSGAQIIGTPLYMSPEQAEQRERDIDTRTDIYSLGAILYEILTGTTPFERGTFAGLKHAEIGQIIREQEPPAPSQRLKEKIASGTTALELVNSRAAQQILKSLESDLDWVIMRALHKDREQRYQTVQELSKDLQRFLQHEPVQARPPSVSYRLRKFCRRNLVGLAVSACFLLLILGSAGMGVTLLLRAMRAEQASLQNEQEALTLLEASRLQQMFAAFEEQNFTHLGQFTLPARHSPILPTTTFSDGSLRGLLLNSGRPRPIREYTHPNAVHDLAVFADEQRFLTACENGVAYIWDVSTGRQLGTLGPQETSIDSVAVSPDQRWLVTGNQAGEVCVWDAATFELVQSIGRLKSGVECLVWSPDGESLAAGARYSETRVWDRQFREVINFQNDHRHECLLFSPDSRTLYVTTRQNVAVWDLATRSLTGTLAPGSLENVRFMCWAAHETPVAIMSDRFTEELVLVDVTRHELAGRIKTFSNYPQHLSLNPERNLLAAAYEDGQIRFFDLSNLQSEQGKFTQDALTLQFSAHNGAQGRVSAAEFLHNDFLLTAGGDGSVRLWNLNSSLPVVSRRIETPVSDLRLHGERLFYFHDHHHANSPKVSVTDLSGTAQTAPLDVFNQPRDDVGNVSDNGWIVVRHGQRIDVINLVSGSLLGSVSAPPNDYIQSVLSQSGRRLAYSSVDNQIVVMETSDRWKTSRRIATVPADGRGGIMFADDDQSLIVDQDNNHLLEWDLKRDRLARQWNEQAGAALALSCHGRYLAVASKNQIRVVDRTTGQLLVQYLNLPRISALLFCENEQVLLSGHHDGRIRGWHLKTQEELGILFQSDREQLIPVEMHFSPMGQRLILHFDTPYEPRQLSYVSLLGPQVDESP